MVDKTLGERIGRGNRKVMTRDQEKSARTPGLDDACPDLALVANVVEELIQREMTLAEWQTLDLLLESGLTEEESVKSLMKTCAATTSEELMVSGVLGHQTDDDFSAAISSRLASGPLLVEGHAQIVGFEDEELSGLEEDLRALGMTVHGTEEPGSFTEPLPALSGRIEPPNFFFVAERCSQVVDADFCSKLMAQGAQGRCAVFLIDQNLELFDRWDEWPVAGVLESPFGAEQILALLDGVF